MEATPRSCRCTRHSAGHRTHADAGGRITEQEACIRVSNVLVVSAQVRHKGTGVEYAIKMVDKHLIVRHRMVGHIKQERNILDECDYPGIARLYFTFQVLQGLPDWFCRGHAGG